ncbi:MAG: YbhN family protein [Bacteroides sp.]
MSWKFWKRKPSAPVEDAPLRGVKAYKAIFPVIIGLGVVAWMFYREFNPAAMEQVHWTGRAVFYLVLALLLMLGRDLGYVWRLMVLAEGRLRFGQAFRVIMLWEFTSAITPSAIGGTSVAILYVAKEGLSVGRSSAVVMATSFLDEVYFLVMFPLLILLVGYTPLFSLPNATSTVARSLFWVAVLGYGIKFAYVLVLAYGFFVNPRGLKWLLLKIFKLPFLRRWKYGAHQAGSEIVESSREFRAKPFGYWLRAFAATFISWTSRYWVANAILLAFFAGGHQFLIFARQLVMWIIMLVSPTPGGSGFSEYVFTKYLGEFIPVSPADLGAVAVVLAFIWRLATYYPYLVVGIALLPRWMQRNFGRKR